MRHFLFIIFNIIVISILYCQKNDSINTITINDTINIDIKEIEILCSGCANEPPCIITNDYEYKNYLKNYSTKQNCKDYKLPFIDFNKYTLLCIYYEYGGCHLPKIKNIFIKLPKQKKYIFITNITQYGYEKILLHSQFFVLISKIELNFKIEFITNYFQKKCDY